MYACGCPCGCSNEYLSQVAECMDCGEGSHQNNNNLRRYEKRVDSDFPSANYCRCVIEESNRAWYDCPVHPDTDCYLLVCNGCFHSYPDCGEFEGENNEV